MLPSSRTVQVNGTATAFVTMINAGANPAFTCSIAPASTLPMTFSYQTTDQSNAVTGTANLPVSIAAGAAQSFVISITPTGAFAPTDLPFTYTCGNSDAAGSIIGVNTLLLSASSTPEPDVIALAATASNDGVVDVSESSNIGAFAVASINLGASATITAIADTGDVTLPLTVNVCQTSPNGQCLAAPAPSVQTSIATNATPTFSIFVTTTGTVPFAPATNRIFMRFEDSDGNTRGSTSVAVRSQ